MEKIYVSIFGQEVPASVVDSEGDFVSIMLDDSSLVFQLTLVEFNRCCRYAD